MATTEIDSSPPPRPAPAAHEQCEQCGAPVEALQRYCVVCGAHRAHAPDPAARFMAAATSRARTEARRAPARTGGGVAPRRRGAGLGTALVVALIPLGVG